MIKVLIQLELVYPYKRSMVTLNNFCSVWDCTLLDSGTNRPIALISMPSKKFKKIFGTNPRIKEYDVPKGTENFITSWNIKKIITN